MHGNLARPQDRVSPAAGGRRARGGGHPDAGRRHRHDDGHVFVPRRGHVVRLSRSRTWIGASRSGPTTAAKPRPRTRSRPATSSSGGAARRCSTASIATRRGSVNLGGLDNPVRAGVQFVTPNYFDFFRWQPVLGRGVHRADGVPGAPRVVVALIRVLARLDGVARRRGWRHRPPRRRAGDDRRRPAAAAGRRRHLRAAQRRRVGRGSRDADALRVCAARGRRLHRAGARRDGDDRRARSSRNFRAPIAGGP